MRKPSISIGVSAVSGEFERGEAVSCRDEAGAEIARGLINYSASETRRILRSPSSEIEARLGYVDDLGYCQLNRDLVVGQRVNVIQGPFVRLMGEVLSMDDKGRTRVLLEIMGGKVITLLERSSIEVAA